MNSDLVTLIDVPYAHTAARTLYLDAVYPRQPTNAPMPAVIFLHGGSWQSGDKLPFYNEFLARAGFFTICPQYRFSREATFPAQIHDAKAAVRWLRANAAQYNIDTERIGIWGHSAGGHTASFVGTSAGLPDYAGDQNAGFDDSVAAVVNVSGVIYLDDGKPRPADSATGRLLGAAPADVPELARAFSPITHIRPDVALPPFLILHGTDDLVVRMSHAEKLYAALRSAGAEATLVPILDGDHSLTANWGIVQQLTLGFFERVFRGNRRTV